MDYSCRISEEAWKAIRTALFTPDGRENAGVLFCGEATLLSERTLLVRDFWAVPGDKYLTRFSDQLEVAPSFYNDVISRSLKHRLSPIIVHSHPGISDAWYSAADDRGEMRLLSVMNSLLPSLHPASLVLSRDSAAGRRLVGKKFEPMRKLGITGACARTIQLASTSKAEEANPEERFDRQVRAFGSAGQASISNLKIAVVGVGGIGSLVAEQLSRLGVQDVIFVDDDKVETVNLNRQFGSNTSDIGQPKAIVSQRQAKGLGASAAKALCDSAIRQAVLMEFRDRDVIFACVDNDRTRALLNRFAHQYLVPVIDHGTRLDGRKGHISASSGRVTLVGSGMACLRCSHHLNSDRIRAESLSKEERVALHREGYIIGIDEPAPAVISLNTVVAGLGVTAALNMFVGLTGGRQPMNQIYDATNGTVFIAQAVHDPQCDVCSTSGVTGIGDQAIVSAYE